MRASYSGSTGVSKTSSVGSIPAARAVNKNTELCSVFLFTRAKRDRNRTSGERFLSEVGRPSEKGSDDKSEQVRAFSGRSGQVSPPLAGGGRGRNSCYLS